MASVEMFRIMDPEVSNEKHDSTSKPSPSNQNKVMSIAFWTAVGASQLAGVASVGLVIYFAVLGGGFSWNNDANLQFNYHPVLMVAGLVFLYGDAILVYRVFSFLPKIILKIIHATLHLGAILCSSIALVAIFENHRRTNKADLYSLHSWIGLATFILFGLQYVFSFLSFLYPGAPLSWRTKMMPFHRFFGLGIFMMAIASALMGLTQKLIWTNGYTSGKTVPAGAVGNSLGLVMVIFGFIVTFLATTSTYKRKPLPEELEQSGQYNARVN